MQYVNTLGNGNLANVVPGAGGTITNSSGTAATLVTNMGASADFGGVVGGGTAGTDNINFVRTGGNTLTLESSLPYSGVTVFTGGTTVLQDNAAMPNTSAITISDATLTLNNNSNLQTDVPVRLNPSAPVTFNGGTFTLTGRFNTYSVANLGAVTFAEGASTIAQRRRRRHLLRRHDHAGQHQPRRCDKRRDGELQQLVRLRRRVEQPDADGDRAPALATIPGSGASSYILGAWAIANNTDYASYNPTLGIGAVGASGFQQYNSSFGAGMLTNLNAPTGVNMVTTLSPSTSGATTLSGGNYMTTAAILRLAGSNNNDIAFTNYNDILNLQLGGLLRSNMAPPSRPLARRSSTGR